MATGFVKLHREVMDHAVFRNPWLWKLFTWCIMRAKYIPSSDLEVPRGSFTTGRIQAADELAASPSSIYRGLHQLEKLGCISLKANSKWTTVSVCNYETYQDSDFFSEQQMNSRRTADEQQMNNDRTASGHTIRREEGKKVRKKEQTDFETPIPSTLDTPRFRAAWGDWKAHRLEIKKPLKPTQSVKQLAKLESIGELRAIAMIEHTIEKGWQGLREPDSPPVPPAPESRVPTKEDDENWNAIDGGLGHYYAKQGIGR
jgi:hypothetical protein